MLETAFCSKILQGSHASCQTFFPDFILEIEGVFPDFRSGLAGAINDVTDPSSKNK